MTRFNGMIAGEGDGRIYDIVIVGSGPAGSMVAAKTAAAGFSVAVIEEGEWSKAADYPLDHSTATARYYRDHGMTVMLGSVPTPYLQGRVVGGTSVINGAISWRLPENVYQSWIDNDPALKSSLEWDELMKETDAVEKRLNIKPTDPAIEGRKNSLMAKGAEALGLEHRPISRNVVDCQGSGRCMQGCPNAAKQSMDITYLADAEHAGADIYSGAQALKITYEKGRATGIACLAAGRRKFHLKAKRALVLAASAVGTPSLLLRSRIKHGPVGYNFSCHPGASVAGNFADPVYLWEGATQGHEVIGLREEGLKFEALGFDVSVLVGRLPGIGARLMENLAGMHHEVDWGLAVKSTALGRVRPFGKKALVSWEPSANDMFGFRKGIGILGKMQLAAGAKSVFIGVRGWQEPISKSEDLDRFITHGPLDQKAYLMLATHMFGTCRIGSDPSESVVGTNFEHHRIKGLYLADSSVFPTNIGVNPQTTILAVAAICGNNIIDNLS